jgi:thiamine transport system substrate-binding protein
VALNRKVRGATALLVVLALGASSCGGGESPSEVVLVTHDSFVMSDELEQDFEQESGLTLKVLQAGDAGEVVAKALLTAGNPQGDVLFGVDNNLLSRALDGDLFESYESSALETGSPPSTTARSA